MLTLTAVIHRDEDMYVAECPEVGTASQGKTIEEAAKNLKEACFRALFGGISLKEQGEIFYNHL